jgi:aldose 1-epimerase
MDAPDDSFVISDGLVAAIVAPAMGAGLRRFDYLGRGKREPLFRPEPEGGAPHPFDLVNIVLVPWSNRISGGGFSFRGKRFTLEPNLAGEAFPLHGNGFSSEWQIAERTKSVAVLTLESAGPGPFRYAAELAYGVGGGRLVMSLEIENRGYAALPFGLGFHPWLVRSPEMLLLAPAQAVWLEDERHMPKGELPVAIPPDWNFDAQRRLPAGLINNAFTGWSGKASAVWPDRGLRLDMEAGQGLPNYIVYSPGAAADFFCFEPVSHPVDAFNLPGAPGLTVLDPEQSIAVTATFSAVAL